jgi:hypothetical protein
MQPSVESVEIESKTQRGPGLQLAHHGGHGQLQWRWVRQWARRWAPRWPRRWALRWALRWPRRWVLWARLSFFMLLWFLQGDLRYDGRLTDVWHDSNRRSAQPLTNTYSGGLKRTTRCPKRPVRSPQQMAQQHNVTMSKCRDQFNSRQRVLSNQATSITQPGNQRANIQGHLPHMLCRLCWAMPDTCSADIW